jgi:pyruvate kinase
MHKRTKIIATIGPASATPTVLSSLITAGVDTVRLNLSHGDHASHTANLELVRATATRLGLTVAVLADLQGPKIRTGRLADGKPVTWVAGARTVVTVAPCPAGTAERVGCVYAGLINDVKAGDPLLVDDGKMRLRVERVEGDEVHCLIEVGGLLKEKKGINLPGVRVSAPALSDKDITDLAWAVANQVDLVALSFVHVAADMIDLRARITALGGRQQIIAKIELPEAVEDIAAICAVSDGIMVARGDLGIEISAEWLPTVQKDLIRAANRQGCFAITATQMLESMIEFPLPTRAETTDIANAILDGTDAVMLSGETASGINPLEAVSTMARIAVVAERSAYLVAVDQHRDPAVVPRAVSALGRAATVLADERRAAAIVVGGADLQLLSMLSARRSRTPIIAACADPAEARRAALAWGVHPVVGYGLDPIAGAIAHAREVNLLEKGDEVVVVEREPLDRIAVVRVDG